MNKKENKPKKDINGKLSTYVVVMLLSIIIVIIIAAMADDREENFRNQIDSTTQANLTIQNELVTLKDENYVLKQDNEKLNKQIEQLSSDNGVCVILNEALKLFNEKKKEEAIAKFSEIDSANLSESTKELYDAIKNIISAQ